MNTKSSRPIGIFDSGLGGLSILRSIIKTLPHEKLIYLGDTARVPYGTRSQKMIIHYARACAKELIRHHVKAIVVACNTVSALALNVLQTEFSLPILGVVKPGAMVASKTTRSGRIGVIATPLTVLSHSYSKEIKSIHSYATVIQQAAPLLVPFVEEGWVCGLALHEIIRHYIEPLIQAHIDTLLLGCTHFSIILSPIQQVANDLSKQICTVCDGSQATADALCTLLDSFDLHTTAKNEQSLEIKITDIPNSFSKQASLFLGKEVDVSNVEQIDI